MCEDQSSHFRFAFKPDMFIGQKTLHQVPGRIWDVVIVGAGPAGSIAAFYLASKGHRVLILDRARVPREKVCGDCLTADALECLERRDLYEEMGQ